MIQNQNSVEFLRLLAAQKQLYLDAKKIGNIRFFASLGISIAGPLLIINNPDTRIWMSIASVLLTIVVTVVLKNLQKSKVINAATIQEQLDTELFGISWNYMLVGNKIPREIIIDADRRFSGNRSKLSDWYPDVSHSYSKEMAIILCQRTNLVWDWRLRERYAWVLGALTAIYGIILIAVCWNKIVVDAIAQLILPSFPLLMLGFESTIGHLEVANKKESKEQFITSLYEGGLAGNYITMEQCRQIQDFIYLMRTRDILVPEFWYCFFRGSFQDDMQAATIDYQNTNTPQ